MKQITEIAIYTCDKCGKKEEVNEITDPGCLPKNWQMVLNKHLCKSCIAALYKWFRT